MIAEKRQSFAADVMKNMYSIAYDRWLADRIGPPSLKSMFVMYKVGNTTTFLAKFCALHPTVCKQWMKYHYGIAASTLIVAEQFFDMLHYKKVPEAEILYKKGFDHVDLLMLADEVDDSLLARELRICDRFERGFWALDALRKL